MIFVPNVGQTFILQKLLTDDLKLKIFGNNHTPDYIDTVASLTEITGGGYVAQTLTFANWTITEGPPGTAIYNAFIDFNFTGVLGGPGTVYGYYITTSDDLTLIWEERFDPADLPFAPINGSLIRIKPRITADVVV